ncbi:MAG: hypothetical protein AAB840_02885 [Patescibacteria group bacterium]
MDNNNKKNIEMMPARHSIRDIPLSRRPSYSLPEKQNIKTYNPDDFEQKGTGGKRKIIYLVLAFVAVCIIIYSTLFASGRITITPKSEVVIFDTEITALKEGGEVSFEIMTLEKELSEEILATGEKQVEERASGKIIIYNNYNDKPQRLIKNTRFETPEGLIYRISDSVVIPGKSGTGSSATPGSLEVVVYADAPGNKYNIGMTDFTIPGFKNDPRYSSFYARSKTSMTGGFIGMKKTVDEKMKEVSKQALREKLKGELFKEASSSKTDSFVLYNDAMYVEFESGQDNAKGDAVIIKEKAVLYGVLFNKTKLSSYIALKTIASFANEPVLVRNLEELDYTAKDKEEKPWVTGKVTFTLIGNPLIVWTFDNNELKKETATKLKKEIRSILATYQSIKKADIGTRPFWKRKFPSDIERIKIIEKLDTEE